MADDLAKILRGTTVDPIEDEPLGQMQNFIRPYGVLPYSQRYAPDARESSNIEDRRGDGPLQYAGHKLDAIGQGLAYDLQPRPDGPAPSLEQLSWITQNPHLAPTTGGGSSDLAQWLKGKFGYGR